MLKVTTSDILSRLQFIIFVLYHSKAFMLHLFFASLVASCVGYTNDIISTQKSLRIVDPFETPE